MIPVQDEHCLKDGVGCMEAACYGLDIRQVGYPVFLRTKKTKKAITEDFFEWTQRKRGGRLRCPSSSLTPTILLNCSILLILPSHYL